MAIYGDRTSLRNLPYVEKILHDAIGKFLYVDWYMPKMPKTGN